MLTRHLLTSLLILAWLTSLPSLALSQADEVTSTPTVETETPVIEFAPEIFTGIYTHMAADLDPPQLLSVHIKGNELLIVDISGHLGFLEGLGYRSAAEASDGLKVSAYDRAFYGTVSPSGAGVFLLGGAKPLVAGASNYSTTAEPRLAISFYLQPNQPVDVPMYVMGLQNRASPFASFVPFIVPLANYVKIF